MYPPRRLVTPEDDEARMLSSDAATIAAEPMFPFAASVLSGGQVVPGPVGSANGGSSGGGGASGWGWKSKKRTPPGSESGK